MPNENYDDDFVSQHQTDPVDDIPKKPNELKEYEENPQDGTSSSGQEYYPVVRVKKHKRAFQFIPYGLEK